MKHANRDSIISAHRIKWEKNKNFLTVLLVTLLVLMTLGRQPLLDLRVTVGGQFQTHFCHVRKLFIKKILLLLHFLCIYVVSLKILFILIYVVNLKKKKMWTILYIFLQMCTFILHFTINLHCNININQ